VCSHCFFFYVFSCVLFLFDVPSLVFLCCPVTCHHFNYIKELDRRTYYCYYYYYYYYYYYFKAFLYKFYCRGTFHMSQVFNYLTKMSFSLTSKSIFVSPYWFRYLITHCFFLSLILQGRLINDLRCRLCCVCVCVFHMCTVYCPLWFVCMLCCYCNWPSDCWLGTLINMNWIIIIITIIINIIIIIMGSLGPVFIRTHSMG
jgi:hypothetical protein